MEDSSSFSLPRETCQVGRHTHNQDDDQVRVSWARKSNILSADVLLSRLFFLKKNTYRVVNLEP